MSTETVTASTPLEPVKDLTAAWREMFDNDPIMKALKEGTMSWADILDDDEPVAPIKPSKPVTTWSTETVESDDEDRYTTPKKLSRADAEAPWAPKRGKGAYIDFSSKMPRKVTFGESVSVPPVIVGRKTLMAKNLPRDITVQQLRAVFEKYGATKDIYIPKNMDRSSPYFGTVKGFAKIAFLKADSAATAFTSEYGRISIGGKNVTLEFANEDR